MIFFSSSGAVAADRLSWLQVAWMSAAFLPHTDKNALDYLQVLDPAQLTEKISDLSGLR